MEMKQTCLNTGSFSGYADEGSDFEKDEDFQHSEQYSGGMPFGLKQRILEIPRHNISNRQDSGIDPGDITPDLSASIMHLQEQGVTIDQSPEEMLNSLFPPQNESPVMTGPVSSSHPQNIVIPLSTSSQSPLCPNMQQVHYAAAAISSSAQQPNNSAFCEVINKTSIRQSNSKGDYDNQNSSTVLQGIEYNLESRGSNKVTRAQIFGSCPPEWFPGFFSVLPNTANIVEVSHSPSIVMENAWASLSSNRADVTLISEENM